MRSVARGALETHRTFNPKNQQNMKLQMHWVALVGVVALFTLGSCAQYSGFQTAKTVGQGAGEFYLAAGGLNTQVELGNDSTIIQEEFGVVVPVFELGGRVGVIDDLDIGLKISSTLNILLDAKYQFIGDQDDSKFAMAVGGAFGYQGGFGSFQIFQAQLPLYVSYHPVDAFAIYGIPRYAVQFATGDGAGTVNNAGFSLGIEAGRKVRFGLDFSYFEILNLEAQDIFDIPNFWQIGAGVKFRFGGNNDRW
jgi:hypothetical protein